MPVYLLGDEIVFPPPEEAENGLLAVGGDLTPERLVAAYSRGIFPWYSEGDPILWHSPDPRFVLTPKTFRVPRSLRRRLRENRYEVLLDGDFDAVVAGCASSPRAGQRGTWITGDMARAYGELHRLGLAHSVEARLDGALVGGLYGVSLGGAFFGESMFAREPDASKVAFAKLVEQLERWDITLIDCQVETNHLARFGATTWSRARYLRQLALAVEAPTRRGRWNFDWAPRDS